VLEGAGNRTVVGRAIKLLVLAGVIALLSASPSKDFFGRYPVVGGVAIVGVVGLLFALFPEAFFLKPPSVEGSGEQALQARRHGARLLGILLLLATFFLFVYMIRVE
jgi:hypothetical protein